jgi:hypothetical protein
MRKITLAAILVLLVGGGVLGALGAYGKLPVPVLKQLGGKHAELINKTLAFLTDIKFKDFTRAASYHAPALQASVDIPFLIQRLFMVKPEQLEVMDYEVLYAEVDGDDLRARVKTRTKVKLLNKDEVRDVEMIYYFYRDDPSGPWFMKLEDSLRNLEAQPGKKT